MYLEVVWKGIAIWGAENTQQGIINHRDAISVLVIRGRLRDESRCVVVHSACGSLSIDPSSHQRLH